MFDYLIKRPMLLSGVFSVIIAAMLFYSKILFIIICILIPFILALMIILRVRPQLILSVIMLVVLLFSCISVYSDINRANTAVYKDVRCQLCVCDITYQSEKFSSAVVEVTGGKIKKGEKISVTYKGNSLYMGQTVSADVTAKALDEDYRNFYYGNGIYQSGRIDNITYETGKDDFVLKTVGRVREYIKETLFSKMSYPSAATMCAVIFGENSYFTDEFYDNVKGAGVSHIMVVSGMHLTVLVMFFAFVTEMIGYNRYIKALVILIVTLLLTALCGFTMSIIRAGVTYALIALSLILKKPYNPENILGAAVTFILINSPNVILSGAFQLSVASTFGILAIASPILNYINEEELIKKFWFNSFVSCMAVTLSAMVMTLPITIKMFGYVSNVTLITNFLICYAVTMILALGIIGLALNLFIPLAADAVFSLCDLITNYINTVINVFGSHEFSVTRLPEYFWIISVLLIIAIFWIMVACKKQRYMIKLKQIDQKILSESGNGTKWRQFLRRL